MMELGGNGENYGRNYDGTVEMTVITMSVFDMLIINLFHQNS